MSADLSEEDVEAQVRRFYARARLDPLLGPVFEKAIEDWEPHLRSITEFWTATMLGTRRYRGDPFGAHKRHPLTPEMFDRWLELWGDIARQHLEPAAAEALVARAQMIRRSLEPALFFNPGVGDG